MTKHHDLMSIEETEKFIKAKLNALERLADADESEMPECTPKELWQDPPTYKYYKNPDKRSRSTANFDSYFEASTRAANDGNVGVIVEVAGKVGRCKWCPAFNVCKQKDRYIANGTLKA